ncbi:DUF397 domain-containing protein [Streptomyces broussonetiae]|uniref:DUF397 domain-containing protein n=2 Tax=Streptomyces broussonetiae TaxID=2686304 RepID=A0ABV5E6D5_9ACTN
MDGWRKSSYSGGNAGDCLEVLDGWIKSSHSGGNEGDCLEILPTQPHGLPVRDSKNPHGPAIVFGRSAWAAFVGHLSPSGV